jgi:hypothetical protein
MKWLVINLKYSKYISNLFNFKHLKREKEKSKKRKEKRKEKKSVVVKVKERRGQHKNSWWSLAYLCGGWRVQWTCVEPTHKGGGPPLSAVSKTEGNFTWARGATREGKDKISYVYIRIYFYDKPLGFGDKLVNSGLCSFLTFHWSVQHMRQCVAQCHPAWSCGHPSYYYYYF